MTNSIQPKPQTDIELWQDFILINAIQWTEQELGYHIDIERLDIQPDLLPENEQQSIQLYEFTLYDYADQDWKTNEEQCRLAQAMIAQRRKQRKTLWLKAKSHQDAREIIQHRIDAKPKGSTKRTLEALNDTYYDDIIGAGVKPQQVLELSMRQDKFLVNAERAISRTVRNDDLTQEQKDDKIREIIDDSNTFQHASDIAKKHINGVAKLICDKEYQKNGEIYVTFLCRDNDDLMQLTRVTTHITSPNGSTIPLLQEQRERIKQNVLEQLTIALAVIQSGDKDALSTVDREIVDVLIEYGYVERDNND